MSVNIKIIYDFYLDGYQNSLMFNKVPSFINNKSILAYERGYNDGEAKKEKLSLFKFSKIVLGLNSKLSIY